MPLTVRTNGSAGSNIITASWFNDFLNLLTGVMQDQEVTIKNVLTMIGIQAAPTGAMTAALASGTNLGIGLYCYQYTWVSADGGETIGSPNNNITTTTGNQKVNLSNVTVGPTGTVARNIYRTKVGCAAGAKLFFVAQIADNVTTTYSDTTADGSLGATTLPVTPSFGGALWVKNPAGTILAKINNDGRFDPAGYTLSFAGSTSGTALMYVPMWGTGLKVAQIYLTNYNTTNTQNFALPYPNITWGFIITPNIGNLVSVLSNGVAQNVQLITSLGTAGAGGGSAGTTSVHANSIGQFTNIDTIQVQSSASSWQGLITVIGL